MSRATPRTKTARTEVTEPTAVRRGLVLLVAGQDHFATYPLASSTITIGRSEDSDICIEDPTLSRHHARLHLDGGLAIEDTGSANGTFLGKRRLAPSRRTAIELNQAVVLGSVTVIVQQRRLGGERRAVRSDDDGVVDRAAVTAPDLGDHVVRDPAMVRIYDVVRQIAASEITVLVFGETGVGKEIVAEILHRSSARAAGPFVRLNCSSLSPALLESELFGHEKGAFTGAIQTKRGLLEAAAGGIVFLDEIGEMPLETQAKLLRALEQRDVMRVGGTSPIAIDVRFVAATHRDLEAMIDEGRFRRDLFFRLNAFSIVIPPLRERRSEIEPMIRWFLTRVSRQLGHAVEPKLTRDAIERLVAYEWPGNVRELRNVVERAAIVAGGRRIGVEHLPDKLRPMATRPAQPVVATLRPTPEVERRVILDALDKTGGNQTEAAALLGIARRTLLTKLDRLGIARPRKKR